jgi:DNA-binding cell septation regulator SpoVG
MIEIVYMRKIENDDHVKALVGFYIPKWDLYLYKCKYVTGTKGPFISFPSQQYEDKQTGEKRYRPSHFMFGKDMSARFQAAAVEAIDRYLAQGSE